jgi:hypothetical protein
VVPLTPSTLGKQPSVSADFTSDGNHSFSFQVPFPSPHTCPRRTTTGCSAVRSEAASRIRSATHFDSEYPVPTAVSGSDSTSSAAEPLFSKSGYVISKKHRHLNEHLLMNTEIEETKTKCGGRASGDVIAKSTKVRTPRILSSKDDKDRLRLIFQAMIHDELSTAGAEIRALSYRYG